MDLLCTDVIIQMQIKIHLFTLKFKAELVPMGTSQYFEILEQTTVHVPNSHSLNFKVQP